jgi:hypothetical protein
MHIGHHIKYLLFLSDFNEITFSRQIFEKYSSFKFNENPSSGSRGGGSQPSSSSGIINIIVIITAHFQSHSHPLRLLSPLTASSVHNSPSDPFQVAWSSKTPSE